MQSNEVDHGVTSYSHYDEVGWDAKTWGGETGMQSG